MGTATVLPAEMIDKPQDKRQYNRDYYATGDGKIYPPVSPAKLQVSRQSK